VKSVVEKFREKYGASDVKKYYSKFDVAVLLETMRWSSCPKPKPYGYRTSNNKPLASLFILSILRGEARLFARFGVKLKNVRAARSTSVEAFRLRSPQARLPPAKDRAGFGEGVLRSHTPTDHSLVPRTSSQYHSAASNATQLHPQAHANFG
jgi:hypothetical protein